MDINLGNKAIIINFELDNVPHRLVHIYTGTEDNWELTNVQENKVLITVEDAYDERDPLGSKLHALNDEELITTLYKAFQAE